MIPRGLFGGRLIANGVAPCIDAAAKRHGEKFLVGRKGRQRMEPENVLQHHRSDVDGHPERRDQPPDRIDGWRKVCADDGAALHFHKPAARIASSPPSIHRRGNQASSFPHFAVQKTKCLRYHRVPGQQRVNRQQSCPIRFCE